MRRKVREEEIIVEERYPDLTSAIALLEKRRGETGEHRSTLINKWIETMTLINKEMRHLERLEEFSTALKSQEKINLERE